MENTPSNEKIYIKMLGQFSITCGEISISDSDNRMHQIWNLLAYLIVFRKKTLSQETLIKILWPDASSDSPNNALKNLIYRIRIILKKAKFPFAKQAILFKNGRYTWNNDLDCVLDTEEFETLIEVGDSTLNDDEKSKLYMRALDTYDGNLIPGSAYEEWVIGLSAYYKSKYFNCVENTYLILMKQHRFEKMRLIGEKAASIDPLEECAHKCLIQALIKEKKYSVALEHYNYVVELFYHELGVRPSEEMLSLYTKITKAVNPVQTDLAVIQEDLNEHVIESGAFYCNYEVFKNMYRIEDRTAPRSGQAIFLALFTLSKTAYETPSVKQFSTIMDILLKSIRKNLRKGDVVSRFSATQFVVMLPTLSYENGQMVVERVSKDFLKNYKGNTMQLHSTLQPLNPIKSEI